VFARLLVGPITLLYSRSINIHWALGLFDAANLDLLCWVSHETYGDSDVVSISACIEVSCVGFSIVGASFAISDNSSLYFSTTFCHPTTDACS
jgi:hypothetical protein